MGILQKISVSEYTSQKSEIDGELYRLKQLQSVISTQVAQMRANEKSKNTRMDLARTAAQANGLTVDLAETLIDRVYVYPGNRLEIVWKPKDFCLEQ